MAATASGKTLPAHRGAGETMQAPTCRVVGLAGLALVLAGWAVYSNSFGGAFIFDDAPSILHNPTVQQGWWSALHPPVGGLTVSGRPLVNLSLALNHHLGGFAVEGYHALNLIIQLLAGLVLFGLVRRTLGQPVLRRRYDAAALPLAFVIALLWTVHPLQTESVTYIVQRAESLMGLLYLLTIYFFVGGAESSRAWAWYALSATACLLGMLTKEVMVSAPLMVLLYDRTFIAGTFSAAWRQRWKFYAVLAATWLPLAWVVANVSLPGNPSRTNPGLAGLSLGMKSYVYALKQCEAIVHYLWLSCWPHPLVLDYGMDVVTNPLSVAPQLVVLVLLLAGTFYALWRQPPLGFLGAWFFLILAPTSSVVPLAGQTMAEHHLYLSLAALIALGILGLYAVLGRHAWIAGLAVATAFGALTLERNRDYHTAVSIWTDTASKSPDSSRLDKSLGGVFHASGRLQEALVPDELALRLNPADAEVENDLGSVLYDLGRTDEAIPHLLQAVKLNPEFAQAYYNLGNAYIRMSQPELARAAFATAVKIEPDFARAHNNLGSLDMVNFHEPDQAIIEFKTAIQDDPTLYEAYASLANLYTRSSRAAEAIPLYEKAVLLNPDFGDAHLGLGNALVLTNQASEAVPQYEAAVRLLPDNASAHGNYAAVLVQLKQYAAAVRQFEETQRLDPKFPDVAANLENARQLAQSTRNGPPQ